MMVIGMEPPFFTIGHSNHSIEEFIELLTDAGVDRLVDVRKLPGSKANPQFDGPALRYSLGPFEISYIHIAQLGGLRSRRGTIPADINAYWTNQSFHNYADYALTNDFREGLSELLALGSDRRCAIMCAEAVWWRCHRRIIADYLIADGKKVFHIMGQGRLELAHLTPGAVVQPDGDIDYPALSSGPT